MLELVNRLIELQAEAFVTGIKEEGINLKSNRISHWYANCRNLAQTRAWTKETARLLIGIHKEMIWSSNIDMVMGVPEGATLIGQEIHNTLIDKGFINDQVYQKRTKPKRHGDIANKYWVTGIKPKNILLFEDTITTGGSLITFIKNLIQEDGGYNVVAVISLIERLQLDSNGVSFREKLAKIGIPYHSTLDVNQVLPPVLMELDETQRVMWTEIITGEYETEYGTGKSPLFI